MGAMVARRLASSTDLDRNWRLRCNIIKLAFGSMDISSSYRHSDPRHFAGWHARTILTGPLNVFFSKIDRPTGQLAPIPQTAKDEPVMPAPYAA